MWWLAIECIPGACSSRGHAVKKNQSCCDLVNAEANSNNYIQNQFEVVVFILHR